MNRRVKTKICVMASAVLIAWGLKRHYATAGADDLWWILSPVARLVGVMLRRDVAIKVLQDSIRDI